MIRLFFALWWASWLDWWEERRLRPRKAYSKPCVYEGEPLSYKLTYADGVKIGCYCMESRSKAGYQHHLDILRNTFKNYAVYVKNEGERLRNDVSNGATLKIVNGLKRKEKA